MLKSAFARLWDSAALKQPHVVMLPPPCFTMGTVNPSKGVLLSFNQRPFLQCPTRPWTNCGADFISEISVWSPVTFLHRILAPLLGLWRRPARDTFSRGPKVLLYLNLTPGVVQVLLTTDWTSHSNHWITASLGFTKAKKERKSSNWYYGQQWFLL